MADSKAIFTDVDDNPDNSGLLVAQPSCLKCGKLNRLMKCCTRCHSAFYCSQVCFAKHWPVHKKICRPNNMRKTVTQTTEADGDEGDQMYRVIRHIKPAAPPHINFQKAADALSGLKTESSAESKEREADLPGKDVFLRYNKQKQKFKVCNAWEAATIFGRMASFLGCLQTNMRMIHKGKLVTESTVRSVIKPGAVFQILGEKMEDCEGLHARDIEVLMQQMSIERNMAIRALKHSQGDLIDAMMALGNK